jgi:FAD/FMN-containing dehydrogenase
MTDHGQLVNDVHAQLNATLVRRVLRPASVAEVREAVLTAGRTGGAIAVAGGRHAMGGQQFGARLDLLDMTGLDRVLDFDPERGEVEAEASIMWPALITWLHTNHDGQSHPWGIIQKQTGADRLTLGGALSSNVHGRVLGRGPSWTTSWRSLSSTPMARCDAAHATRMRSSSGLPSVATGCSGRSCRFVSSSRRGARSAAW